MNSFFERSIKILNRLEPALHQILLSTPPITPPFLFTEERKEEIANVLTPRLKTLVFFGLDDGATYRFLRSWLKNDPEHRIIFLEVSLGKIRGFLETEAGAEFMEDPQALLLPGNPSTNNAPYPRQDAVSALLKVPTEYLFLEFQNESLQRLYEKVLQGALNSDLPPLHYHFIYQKNFYKKLSLIEESIDMRAFVNLFKEIPALIIGAGPSLSKEIGLLHEMEDKAILIGAGTGIKALFHHGITPHFLVGLDPNYPQIEILSSQDGPKVPLIFSERFYQGAVPWIGPYPIYIRTIDGDQEYAAFLDPLVGHFYPHASFSSSSSVFATECALIMGSSPTLLLGIDLSYGACKKYSDAAVSAHALTKAEEFRLQKLPNDVIVAIDEKKVPHITTLTFLREVKEFAEMAQIFSPQKIYKTDKEGFSIPNVSLKSLSDFLKEGGQKNIDLSGLIHSALQVAKRAATGGKELREALKKRKELLEKVVAKKETLQEEDFNPNLGRNFFLFAKKVLLDHSKIKLIDLELHPEHCQETVESLNESIKKKALLLAHDLILHEKKLIEEALDTLAKRAPSVVESPPTSPKRKDSIGKSVLWMDGKLEQFLEEEPGASRFFSKEGILLSETFYKNGKKEGLCRTFYRSGESYSNYQYKEGKLEGKVIIFYKDGSPKEEYFYENGKLKGQSKTYYPEGCLAYSCQYQNGVRNGVELKYTEEGIVILEASYKMGKAIGTTHIRFPTGETHQKIVFNSEGKITSLQVWNEAGQLVREESEKRKIFDIHIAETETLLQNMLND